MSTRTQPPRLADSDVLRASLGALFARLPGSWTREVRLDATLNGRGRADALVEIAAPDGARAELVVEAKKAVSGRDVPGILARVRRLIEALDRPATPLLVARYLAPSVRDALAEQGVGYADATGNIWLSLEQPALFVRDVGAQSDPWRGRGRPRGDLSTPNAARVVRALVDFAPPYGVPELARRAGTSPAATYRLVDSLADEALLERAERGPIASVEWRRLLERWAERFREKAPVLRSYLEPRGLDALIEKLRQEADGSSVLTGSLAAAKFAPAAPARLAMIYASDPEALAARLGLRETETGANVLLGAPLDRVILERARVIDGLLVAAPSQTAADLLVSPGRGPAEAEALLDWMEADESAWRA